MTRVKQKVEAFRALYNTCDFVHNNSIDELEHWVKQAWKEYRTLNYKRGYMPEVVNAVECLRLKRKCIKSN